MKSPPENACPHCAQPVFRLSDGGNKLKAKTSILVLHKAGALEINCGSCGRGIVLPVQIGAFELKKAAVPTRLVVPTKG